MTHALFQRFAARYVLFGAVGHGDAGLGDPVDEVASSGQGLVLSLIHI